MDQNANIKNTKSLEAEMRSLSPRAAERIKAAWKSMEIVLQASEEGDFVKAETASDIAGRLLRKADSAASKDQKEKRQRGRRKGLRIQISIMVIKLLVVTLLFKENIMLIVAIVKILLKRFKNSNPNIDDDDQQLLDNYLRQVIR